MPIGECSNCCLHAHVLLPRHPLQHPSRRKARIDLRQVVRNGCVDRNVQKGAQALPVGLREEFAIRKNLINHDVHELREVGPAVFVKTVSRVGLPARRLNGFQKPSIVLVTRLDARQLRRYETTEDFLLQCAVSPGFEQPGHCSLLDDEFDPPPNQSVTMFPSCEDFHTLSSGVTQIRWTGLICLSRQARRVTAGVLAAKGQHRPLRLPQGAPRYFPTSGRRHSYGHAAVGLGLGFRAGKDTSFFPA